MIIKLYDFYRPVFSTIPSVHIMSESFRSNSLCIFQLCNGVEPKTLSFWKTKSTTNENKRKKKAPQGVDFIKFLIHCSFSFSMLSVWGLWLTQTLLQYNYSPVHPEEFHIRFWTYFMKLHKLLNLLRTMGLDVVRSHVDRVVHAVHLVRPKSATPVFPLSYCKDWIDD